MRSSLVSTGFNLAVATLALLLWFLVGHAAAVTTLFLALAVHTVRPFLSVLDGEEAEAEGESGARETSALLALLSRDVLEAGGRAAPAKNGADVPGLLVLDLAPDWQKVPDQSRTELAAALAEANHYLAEESYFEARKRYRRLVKALPADPAINHNLGVIYLLEGDHVRARPAFLKALFCRPDDEKVYEGLIHSSVNSPELAVRAFERARALAPSDSRPHFRLARYFLARGLPDRARETVEKYLAANPAEPGPARKLRAWARFLQGAEALALADFQEHLVRSPWDREARVGEGLARIATGDAEGGEKSLGNVLREARQSRAVLDVESALLGSAVAFQARGEFLFAEQAALAVRSIDPDHRGALFLQCLAAWEKARAERVHPVGDPLEEPALVELRKLVALDRPHPLAAYCLGRAYLLSGAAGPAVPVLELAQGPASAGTGAGGIASAETYAAGTRAAAALAVAHLAAGKPENTAGILSGRAPTADWASRWRILSALSRLLSGDESAAASLRGEAGSDAADPLVHRVLLALAGPAPTRLSRVAAALATDQSGLLPQPSAGELLATLLGDGSLSL